MRTLGGILATGRHADVTRLGWPTLRAGFPLMTFLNAMREMRARADQARGDRTPPVMAVIGAGDGRGPQHRRARTSRCRPRATAPRC